MRRRDVDATGDAYEAYRTQGSRRADGRDSASGPAPLAPSRLGPSNPAARARALAPPRRGFDRRPARGRLSRFTRRYGWRAYAVPLLVVVTLVALTSAGRGGPKTSDSGGALVGGSGAGLSSSAKAVSAPPTETGDHALKTDDPAVGSLNNVLRSDVLPPGGAYTQQGTGKYSIIPGSGPIVGTGALHKYSVEVEGGISGIDLAAFASEVQIVLSDPKSWTGGSGIALQRVDSGPISFHVTLTSSITLRSLCGYEIPVETSCFVSAGQSGSPVDRVVLNDSRWVRGDAAYIGDVAAYRTYMINHETGHALGHLHAHSCLADGYAPAMMQQTIGLKSTTGQLCEANPWPFPPGATDAPGPEAPDTTLNNQFTLQNE